jgi:hypothetical protein
MEIASVYLEKGETKEKLQLDSKKLLEDGMKIYFRPDLDLRENPYMVNMEFRVVVSKADEFLLADEFPLAEDASTSLEFHSPANSSTTSSSSLSALLHLSRILSPTPVKHVLGLKRAIDPPTSSCSSAEIKDQAVDPPGGSPAFRSPVPVRTALDDLKVSTPRRSAACETASQKSSDTLNKKSKDSEPLGLVSTTKAAAAAQKEACRVANCKTSSKKNTINLKKKRKDPEPLGLVSTTDSVGAPKPNPIADCGTESKRTKNTIDTMNKKKKID